MDFIRNKVNGIFKDEEPFRIVCKTAAAGAAVYYGAQFAKQAHKDGLKKTVVSYLFSLTKNVPGVAGAIAKEQEKTLNNIEEKLMTREDSKETVRFNKLPQKPLPQEQILSLFKKWSAIETSKWDNGKVSGSVYHGEQDFLKFLVEAYGYFALSNPLHADLFPFVRKMEAEVIRMCLGMYNGDEKACGAMTSGGTESIFMAMKAYRESGRARGITKPEIIVPITAHAAFNKSCDYLAMKLVIVPVTDQFVVDPKVMEKHITANTVAIVGSCPNFPQGTIDPIPELSEIALRHDVGLHVDCCLGGFIVPFLEKLGYKTPMFDFRLPGVTSISCDTHKYGYSPKGTSVIMYRSTELRRHQYFLCTDWPGGIYATPTMSGSRPGGLTAATWAAMVALGEDGYLQCTKEIMHAAKTIENGIRNEIDGLTVMGKPLSSVVAFDVDKKSAVGKKLNIFMISDAMTQRGWSLNTLQKPGCVHIACTYQTRNSSGLFLKDLQDSVNEVIQFPNKHKAGSAALYGVTETLPDTSVVDGIAAGYLDIVYKTH